MSAKKRNQTKMLTVGAMLSALGVVVLSLGSFITTLDLTVAALASFFCIYAVIEMGGAYPWMIWGVISFLGMFLPQKTPAILFLFIGCYPIFKAKFEKRPRWLCLTLKLVTFHVMAGLFFLTLFIFFPTDLVGYAPWMFAIGYVLAVVTFMIYDYALSKMITLYLFRLRDRFRLKLKK